MKVLHVITGLSTGGAEQALLQLVTATSGDALHEVIALGPAGPLAGALASRARVDVLGAASVAQLPAVIRGLRRAVAERRPDLLQGWMYHGNVAASLAASGKPVLWGVRQCLTTLRSERPGTRMAILAGIPLSRGAARIIYNSAASAAQHERLGYAHARTLVVPNGFDSKRFRPSSDARAQLRASLAIPAEAQVVVHLARAHPVKDHRSFALGLAALLAREPELYVLMAGQGIDRSNEQLRPLIEGVDQGRVHLLGERHDVDALLAASDVLCLTSRAEAFPNVVGEAMAAGLAVVATDVGDVRRLLGDDGILIPPGDPNALSAAVEVLLARGGAARRELGMRLRARVQAHFSPRAMGEGFLGAWRAALAGERFR